MSKCGYCINNAYSYLPFCITPVPVHDIMTVAGNFNIIYELTVFSTSGKPLLHWNDLPQRVAVNVFDLPEGFYIVHAVTDNGIFTSKILKH